MPIDKTLDYNVNEMSIEEFQRIAEKHFANNRFEIEGFNIIKKNTLDIVVKKETELIYVQSLSGMGLNSNEFKISLGLENENYFVSQLTDYILINDCVVDEISVDNVNSIIYVVGFKAVTF